MKPLLLPALASAAALFAVNASAQDYWGDSGAPVGAAAATGASSYGYDSGTDYASDGGGGDYNDSGRGFSSLLGESDFDYGYLDASYYWFDFDDDNFDSGNGFGGALSIAVIDSVFIKAAGSYAASETQDGDDVDYLDWQAGAGIGLPIMNRFDIVLEGGLAHRSLNVDGINDFGDLVDGYGWYVAPGVRVGLNDYMELNGTVRYTDVGDESGLGLDIKALLHLTPSISISGGVLFSDDANQYGAGLRINF